MRIRWILVCALAALAVGPTAAQGPRRDLGRDAVPLGDPDEVDPGTPFSLSIDVNLVNVDVVVTTREDQPISGLEQDQFRVFVDDVEQTITNFRPTEAPLTVVLLIEFGQTFSYYYDDVVGPAWGFVQSLRPDDWAALVNFDVRADILTDFTKNRNDLLAGLQSLQIPTFRETAVFDAIMFTLDRMENIDGKKAIFLLSAGMDTISRATYGEVLNRAEASDTIIYAVGMGQLFRTIYENQLGALDRITLTQAENTLRQITRASGGLAFFPRFRGEYLGIYEIVGAHLRYQYSLGFVPAGIEADDDLKEIKVEIAPTDVTGDGRPDDLRVRHKRGFYMTDPD
jgi:VWFA-related protein